MSSSWGDPFQRSVGGGKATQAAGGVATGASLHTYKTELPLLLPASTLIKNYPKIIFQTTDRNLCSLIIIAQVYSASYVY